MSQMSNTANKLLGVILPVWLIGVFCVLNYRITHKLLRIAPWKLAYFLDGVHVHITQFVTVYATDLSISKSLLQRPGITP